MSRSSRQKEKYEKEHELFEDPHNDGTAARTRPFSFDEIMLRRKNKKQFGNVEDTPEGAATITGKGISEKVFVRGESKRHRHNGSVTNIDSATNSHKPASNESVKVSSRRKEDVASTQADKSLKGEEKGGHDIERKTKSTLNTDTNVDKAKGGKKDKRLHDKRKDELSVDDSGYNNGKRDSKVYVSKDRHADGNRGKSEVVGKGKKENEYDGRSRDRNAGKKHDSQKWHNEFSERQEKKEASQSRREDSRSKRRRSRSREHEQEKSRRSLSPSTEKMEKKEASKSRHEDSRSKRRRSRSREHDKDRSVRRPFCPSPKGHKRSYDGQEHGELTSHSSKDRSERFNSDLDKRTQMNGSSNQSRWHGVSASRLGGYSPRKRRSEAAIKTPSPPSRSPEKKNAGWDLAPVKRESNYLHSVLPNLESLNQTVLPNEPELSSVVTAPSSTLKPILGVVSSTPSLKMNFSIDSIQLTQATRPKRRLYVENLPSSASEEAVMEWLNTYLLSSGVNHIQGTKPCISCIVNKEKSQALLEFLTPEDATAALSFDGRTLSGSILKIRRPKDFADVTTGVRDESVAAADSVGDTVEDSPDKIFVGGIPKVVSSEMLMEIASAFGPLKTYHFETNIGFNGSCAFLEYVDHTVTAKACSGLNGMRLGGQMLTVTRAIPNASSVDNFGNKPFYGIPDHARPLLEEPTEVLMLSNVLDPNSLSLLSEPELEEALEDIRLECARFGTVKSINIVNLTKQSTSIDVCEDSKNTGSAVEEDSDDKKQQEREGINLVTVNAGRSESSVSLAKKELEEVEEPAKRESSRDVVDPAYLTTCTTEPEEDSSKAVEADYTPDHVHTDNLVKDEICDRVVLVGSVVDENALKDDSSSQLSSPIETQLDCIKTREPEMENEVLIKVDMNPEDENGKLEKTVEPHSLQTELDPIEKGKNKVEIEADLKDVFEPGSVLVEFKRAEASSIAAHCLHGRLFDNRIVRVGYVAHDLYCARFPK